MRRILHIIDSLDYSGAAAQLLLLGKGLAQQGFDVHVCALNHHAPRLAEYLAAGIPAAVIPRRFPIDPLADLHLVRHVRRLRPDLIHTWNSVAGMLGPVVTGRRLIAGQYRIERWQSAWELFFQRRFARHAARYVTNSNAVRVWCIRQGLPAEKFAVIPAGIELARPSDVSREELLRELKLPAEARLIGVVGRLVPEKRVKDLIWAADLLRVLHDNLRMLIIGDGPLRSQLEEYARLASDLDHIQFLGARGDVWRILPHLDVLWNGSENLGQSSAILEAMAAGVPVIASDTPTNRELVVDGETGYLIPLGTRAGRAARARCTDQIFTDSTLVARLAEVARQRITAHFSVDRLIETHLQLHHAVLN